MELAALIANDAVVPPDSSGVPVHGLSLDSRTVVPGDLFAALAGTQVDGARFIPMAVERGASAVLVASTAVLPENVTAPVVRADDPHRVLARVAARFFARQPKTIVAVTGTSGKSSVVDFARQIWTRLGHDAASLGTLGVTRSDDTTYGSLTTPDPITLHKMLSELAGEGVTHLAFEASSHGLVQRRLDGVDMSAAAFTNLGHDHLDYHADVEDYLAAKIRLFDTLLEPGRPAVIELGGARSADVADAARKRGLMVMGVGEGGDLLRLDAVRRDGFRQVLTITASGRSRDVSLPLIGTYQATNALVAAGLVVATGGASDDALDALTGLRGVCGRLDIVGEHNGGIAVVDYAHKPDALEAALAALCPFATGRLICIIGCGGDRDREKRPVMGRIAVTQADVAIITDDNPRSEEPAQIRADMLVGAPGAREIGDRREAIVAGVRMLGPGDVLLVAGKGHENGQIIGDTVIPFSDHEEIAKAISGADAP